MSGRIIYIVREDFMERFFRVTGAVGTLDTSDLVGWALHEVINRTFDGTHVVFKTI